MRNGGWQKTGQAHEVCFVSIFPSTASIETRGGDQDRRMLISSVIVLGNEMFD